MQKVALVTGANRGLGFEIARQLARTGATVIIGARRPDAGEAAARALRDEGLHAETVRLDVDDATSVRHAAAIVEERHTSLDILVNNAGILPEATAASDEIVDEDVFERTLATNLLGAVRTIQHFLPLLRRSADAHIVNVSSTVGSLFDQLNPDSPYYSLVLPAYQASKAALNSVTIGLSKSLADTCITVNAVCPGFVQTDLTPASRAQAPLTAAEAAQAVVQRSVIEADRATGQFFDRDGTVAW